MELRSQSDVKETCKREITNCLGLTPGEVLSFSKDIHGNASHASCDVKVLLQGEIAFVFACLRLCFQTGKYEAAVKLIMESSGRIRFFMTCAKLDGLLEADSIHQVYMVLSTAFELLDDGNSLLNSPAGR